jgi:hypothetical protein
MHLPVGRRRREVTAAVIVLVVTVVSTAIRQNSPAYLGASWTFDDALFTKLASSILDGEWLGPYDFLTLSKGPGFPIFLAAAYKLHLPLMLAEHLLHLVAAGTIGFALARITRSYMLGVVAYAIVALNPTYFGMWASFVNRDSLYSSLSLLFVGATLLVASYVPLLVRWKWLAIPFVVVAGSALGLIAGGYILTREERVWLAPAVLLAAVAGTTSWRRQGEIGWRHAVVCAAIVVVAVASLNRSIDWVADRNDAAYGTRVISDLAEGNIARAYIEWQRVEAGTLQPLISVNYEQREAVYDISPAAAELEAYLKGVGTHWMGPDCAPPIPDQCEYSAGFFVWAMREAAQATGHMSSGAEAQRFFGDMADQIAEACGSTLECTDPGFAPMPPLEHIEEDRIPPSFWTSTQYLLRFGAAEQPWDRQSLGTPEEWELMTRPLRAIDGTRAEYNAYEAKAVKRQESVSALTHVYRWAAQWGALPALLGLALVVTPAGRRRVTTAAVGVVMLVATLSRLMLLALVDATAFRTADYGTYILPGVDFLLVFLVVGWWLLVRIGMETFRHRRGEQPSGHTDAGDEDLDSSVTADNADVPRPLAPDELISTTLRLGSDRSESSRPFRLLLGPEALPAQDLDVLRDRWDPHNVLAVLLPEQGGVQAGVDGEPADELARAWRDDIPGHLGAYLSVRWELFCMLIGVFDPPAVVVHPGRTSA